MSKHTPEPWEDLLEALQKIADLDPEEDSSEGYNEWGEAECFNIAQKIADAAIKKAKGGPN